MTKKRLIVILAAIFWMGFFILTAYPARPVFQKVDEENLAQKYQDFLKNTQGLMLEVEKEVFMMLQSDRDRDIFIKSFWAQRENSKVRDNITTLMLLRLTQVLELTEEQTVVLFPHISRVEKGKKKINQEIGKNFRDLRVMLRQEIQDPGKLSAAMENIRTLRDKLKDLDADLEKIVAGNLTVVQQAKYLIFFQDFYRGLRDKLNQARETLGRQKKKPPRK